MISAHILADSASAVTGTRITTFLLRYPRFVHEELLTHRAFSRNAASSRAIPVKRLAEMVRTEPAMPVHWGTNKAGMQAGAELEGKARAHAIRWWRAAAYNVVQLAEAASAMGLHKQLANRWLHPVQPYAVLVTATEWDDFWLQRPHPAAQPEFQDVAYEMLAAYLASTPAVLNVGEWHMPFGDRMEGVDGTENRLKVATARAARLSYLTFDGLYAPEEDFRLHDDLSGQRHWSPFEHAATPFDGSVHRSGATRNFRDWVPYREYVEPRREERLSRAELEAILAARTARCSLSIP